jgi:hypothetical protein
LHVPATVLMSFDYQLQKLMKQWYKPSPCAISSDG